MLWKGFLWNQKLFNLTLVLMILTCKDSSSLPKIMEKAIFQEISYFWLWIQSSFLQIKTELLLFANLFFGIYHILKIWYQKGSFLQTKGRYNWGITTRCNGFIIWHDTSTNTVSRLRMVALYWFKSESKIREVRKIMKTIKLHNISVCISVSTRT